MSNSKSIKDLLQEGMSEESIIKELKEQIIEAQKEIRKEQEKEESALDIARMNLIKALIKYFNRLDIFKEKVVINDDLINSIKELLKEIEPEIKKYSKILNILLNDDEEEEEKEQPAAWIPTSLTKYGVNVAPVDLDSKLSDLIKGLMKE